MHKAAQVCACPGGTCELGWRQWLLSYGRWAPGGKASPTLPSLYIFFFLKPEAWIFTRTVLS